MQKNAMIKIHIQIYRYFQNTNGERIDQSAVSFSMHYKWKCPQIDGVCLLTSQSPHGIASNLMGAKKIKQKTGFWKLMPVPVKFHDSWYLIWWNSKNRNPIQHILVYLKNK